MQKARARTQGLGFQGHSVKEESLLDGSYPLIYNGFLEAGVVHATCESMKWQIEDVTPRWLKVRSQRGRRYFITWDQDPAFIDRSVVFVIPADPDEGLTLCVPLKAGEITGMHKDELATYAFRDEALVKLWTSERRKLEATGEL